MHRIGCQQFGGSVDFENYPGCPACLLTIACTVLFANFRWHRGLGCGGLGKRPAFARTSTPPTLFEYGHKGVSKFSASMLGKINSKYDGHCDRSGHYDDRHIKSKPV